MVLPRSLCAALSADYSAPRSVAVATRSPLDLRGLRCAVAACAHLIVFSSDPAILGGTSYSLTKSRRCPMDTLRLFFEGWLALSTISYFVCACLADDRDTSTPPGRRQAVTRDAALAPRV